MSYAEHSKTNKYQVFIQRCKDIFHKTNLYTVILIKPTVSAPKKAKINDINEFAKVIILANSSITSKKERFEQADFPSHILTNFQRTSLERKTT